MCAYDSFEFISSISCGHTDLTRARLKIDLYICVFIRAFLVYEGKAKKKSLALKYTKAIYVCFSSIIKCGCDVNDDDDHDCRYI